MGDNLVARVESSERVENARGRGQVEGRYKIQNRNTRA